MMSTAISAPMKIIETISRSSSFIFGTNNPTLLVIKMNSQYDDDNPVILPFRVGFLTPELEEEATTELNETAETREICLSELRELIENEENLVCRGDDNFLLQFLRARKFNVKKSFKLVQSHFEFRKEYCHIYNFIDVKVVKRVILHNYFGYLTMRDRQGSVVFLTKLGFWDPSEDTVDDLMKAISGVLVHAAEDPATQVAGFRIIFDCRGLSWKQVKHCTPQNALLVIRSTQFCFPARYKAIHIFSENRLFNILWTIAHPFLTKKLKKRIIHHGKDVNALHEFIHPSILPEEYGGTQGRFDNSSWEKIIDSEEPFMMDMLKYGYK